MCEFTQSEDDELQTLAADPAAAHSRFDHYCINLRSVEPSSRAECQSECWSNRILCAYI